MIQAVVFGKTEDIRTIGHLAERLIRTFRESAFARPDGTIIAVEEELRGELIPGLPDLLARVDLIVETDTSFGSHGLQDGEDGLEYGARRRVGGPAPALQRAGQASFRWQAASAGICRPHESQVAGVDRSHPADRPVPDAKNQANRGAGLASYPVWPFLSQSVALELSWLSVSRAVP
jgi:hypothetical protein